MSAYKIQTPGNYPEESTQNSEHGKSLKSRMYVHLHTRGNTLEILGKSESVRHIRV